MKEKNNGLKLVRCCIFAAALLCMVMIFSAGNAQAASAKNKKAKGLYEKKISRLTNVEMTKYADLTGDGVWEAIVEAHDAGGSGRTLYVFTTKSGKVVNILKYVEYGASRMGLFKKTKSLIVYGAGHGSEWYAYFKLKNAKYKLVAEKFRVAEAGGAESNGPWQYYNKSKQIKKSAFTKLTSGMAKGSKKTVKFWAN